MPALRPRSDPVSLTVRRLAGVTIARIAGERPLMRAVPHHLGTTLHLSGRSRWRSRGVEWSVAPGDVSVKVPGEVAIEEERLGTPDFQVVLFDEALVEEARVALGRPSSSLRARSLHPRDPSVRPLLALHRHALAADPDSVIEEASFEALRALVDTVDEPGHRERRPSAAVARARKLLDERYTETVGLDALAAHARLDKFRLCRAFHEEVGLPPHAYVTHRRVALAQELLARGVSQAEVAARVGFYDQSLLHRHFKQILHVTPGAFARAARR